MEETQNATQNATITLDETFNVRTQLDLPIWLMTRLDDEARIYGQSRAAHLRTILIERYGAPKAVVPSVASAINSSVAATA